MWGVMLAYQGVFVDARGSKGKVELPLPPEVAMTRQWQRAKVFILFKGPEEGPDSINSVINQGLTVACRLSLLYVLFVP